MSLLGLGIIFLFVLVAIHFLVIRPLYFAPLSHIPGPLLCKISWYYLARFDLRYERNTQIHRWHKKYGPVVCIRPNEISLASSTDMREIYGCPGRYEKSAYFDSFIAYGERPMFSALSYHEHQQKRRILSSFYQATNIKEASILGVVRERTQIFVQVLDGSRQGSKSLDVFTLANRFAFDNITRLLYGRGHGTFALEHDEYVQELLQGLKSSQFLVPLYDNFPYLYAIFSKIVQGVWPQKASGFTAGKRLEEWTTAKINSVMQRNKQIPNPSLLDRLLSIRDSSHRALSGNFIACELLDNVNAAQETVGVALTYFIWHLSRQDEWQRKIRAELRELPTLEDGLPGNAEIDSAVLLEAFLKEVYRVNPGTSGRAERVVPAGGRSYSEMWVPEGTIVSASTISLHQDPLVFYNPSDFQPQRWLNSTAAHLRQMESSFVPFGYGARICTGKAFATLQIKTLISAIYRRYSTRIGDGMDEATMWQTGTPDALPWGLKCNIIFEEL